MSDPRAHIIEMRSEKYWLNDNTGQLKGKNPLASDLQDSINHLAEGLYSKDVHFIFELIQNAEDNAYDVKEPSLSFRLIKTDPTGTKNSNGALIIQNNEVGFSTNNVNAICAVGKTTKSKAQGYIGEKGIGFKSVFRVTTNPHIFSKGYSISLPEYDEETGLGYIVPKWVEEPLEDIIKDVTTIILPLDQEKTTPKKLIEYLKDIAPETILFLEKIKTIEIKVEIENQNYEIIIEKNDKFAPLIELTYSKNDEEIKTTTYWLESKEFTKPDYVSSEKRKGIEKRTVSVALLLDKGSLQQKLFAFLPVWDETGLPFIMNADFLLVSSRQGLHEDDPWNKKWLREQIALVYRDAFLSCLQSRKVTKEQKCNIYASIPTSYKQPFLAPVVEAIQKELRNYPVVLTEPDFELEKPEQVFLIDQNFRNLLQRELYPDVLQKRIVVDEIVCYEDQLQAIGVENLSIELEIQCFQDKKWLAKHDYDWLLQCYYYLQSSDLNNLDLRTCPIVPAMVEDEVYWTCDHEQPIYFEYGQDFSQILEDVPECARVPMAFLDSPFFELIKENKKICDWMENALKIKKFTTENRAKYVLNWLKDNYKDISDSELIAATLFLSKFGNVNDDFEDFPILLGDDGRMLLSEARELPGIQAVVVPENYDPETGWQNVFVMEDREHFIALSDKYESKLIDKLLKINLIDKYPPPKISKLKRTPQSVTEVEIDYLRPDGLSENGKSMTAWLNCLAEKKYHVKWPTNKGDFDWTEKLIFEWAYYKKYYEQADRPYFQKTGRYKFTWQESKFFLFLKTEKWLPTTKGFTKPSQAFLNKPELKEILGDSVPYFEGKLPENIIQILGIQTQATTKELVSALERYSEDKIGSKEFAERVYQNLASRQISHEILDGLRAKNIIYNPSDSDRRWIAVKDVIWKNREDVLGTDFIYLESIYPKLKDFFTNQLQVKEDVDTEVFANQWVKIQNEHGKDCQEIVKILTKIYPEIRKITRQAEKEPPDWWSKFRAEAKIWTQSKTFENPQSVYVPDDGDLQAVFENNRIFFAWRPEKDTFAEWEEFYKAFSLRSLSESVRTHLIECNESVEQKPNKFLTDGAKVLIITWIKELHRKEFQRLLDKQLVNLLFDTSESSVTLLKLCYCLGETKIEKTTDSFWDKDAQKLFVGNGNDGRIKNSIARTLAHVLMPNRASKELADWIELVLGETDWEWRLGQKGWQVPTELEHFINRKDKQTEPTSITEPEPSIPTDPGKIAAGIKDEESQEPKQPSNKIGPKQPPFDGQKKIENVDNDVKQNQTTNRTKTNPNVPAEQMDSNFNYPIELIAAFNRPEKRSNEEIKDLDEGKVSDPEGRRGKEAAGHIDRITNEPAPADRIRITERALLEGPDEAVRSVLEEWYEGKCQICKSTFKQRNGRPFFIASYLVQRKFARQVDTYANAICLCAEHFARWQHGAVQAQNILNQILSLKCQKEGGDSLLRVQIKLCGKECNITFCEKHIVALQELLNVSQPNGVPNLQPGNAI